MEWAAGGMTMVNPMNMTQPSPLEHRDVDMGTGWALSYLSATQKYSPHEEYHFLRGGGTGVDVYVVDTGVNPIDGAFTGGMTQDYTMSDDHTPTDKVGHGTLVASIVASRKYGAAKNATIRSMKCGRKGNPVYSYVNTVLFHERCVISSNLASGHSSFGAH